MGYLFVLVISLCFAGLLYYIARRKGSNKTFWAVMGFFFGPFAIPFMFFSKKPDPKDRVKVNNIKP
jgi:RsiW-degrading membrane proteinase PrsW (M82 family)